MSAHCVRRLLRSYEPLCRRHGAYGTDLDDAKQEIALRLLERGPRSGQDVSKPEAYRWRVARSAVVDYVRRRSRQGRATAADWLDERPAPPAGPAYELAWARIQQYVHAYAARAARGAHGKNNRAAEQVWAWFYLRVDGRSGAEVATKLDLPARQAPLVWKWAERGRDLVKRLARVDEDRTGGRLMARLAEETGRAAA